MRFFWIHGAAGIGKSTLAHRLLDLVKGEGILGTFAYFSIGNDIGPQELVRMMARELSSLHPGCRHEIARAIKECSGTHESLEQYLTNFLVKPVASLKYASSLVIILDALDEWAYREIFLETLHQVIPLTLSLKFVMTSRHPPDTKSVAAAAATLYKLTTVSPAVCRKYFEERFNDLTWRGPRPDEVKLVKLVNLADGLLIWAATVCTLVTTPHPEKLPLEILNEILSSSLTLGHEKRMKELYRQALERIFPAEHEESRLKIFLSMVALREDLPLTEFARLVKMTPGFIQDVCLGLRALQTRGTFDNTTVQPAVKLFHASFIEHLGQLNEAHGVMANNCIHFLKRVTGPDVDKKLGLFPPQQMEQYVGEHWVYHLQEAPPEKHPNLFLNVPSNQLRVWVGCLLSHLFRLGNKHGYGPGSDQDIDRAIFHHQNAVEFTPSDHDDIPGWFNNLSSWFNSLGSLYAHRFECTGGLQNIDCTISRYQSAVDFTPSGHTDLPRQLNNLGNFYLRRFECTGNLQDVDHAISHNQSAVEDTPSSCADLPHWLNDLGSSYAYRFKCTSNLQDIDLAISYFQSAVESTPSGHANLSPFFFNLGYSYLNHFEHTGYFPNVQNSIASYCQAAEENGTPSICLVFAKIAAMLSSVHDGTHCLVDFSIAISLLSEVSGLEQITHGPHANPHGHFDLVRSAVATALHLNKVDLAVEWLEQSRCLLWNQLNQPHISIHNLCVRNSSLADHFITVATALQSYGTHSISSIPSSYASVEGIHFQYNTQNHTLPTTEYRQLLEEIRAFPDFHNFLRPPKATNLFSLLPSDGPVIIFNIHNTRCDALALIAGVEEPLHIPLENFSLVQAEELQKTLQFDLLKQRSMEDHDRAGAPHRVRHTNLLCIPVVLKELWYKVVQPILEALAYSVRRCDCQLICTDRFHSQFDSPANPSNRGRLWWCPTGPLTFLPLHAAGIYGSAYKPGSRVSDFVVSSYTPTVQFLNEKFSISSTSPKCTSLVLISPNTPDLPSIPGTRTEIHNVKALVDQFAIDALLLEDDEATTDKVKREMNAHSWVHFACHGIQDTNDPLESGIHLHDGRLELLEII